MSPRMKYFIIRIFQLLYQNRFTLRFLIKFLNARRVHLLCHLIGYLISLTNLYKKLTDNIKQILYLVKITLTAKIDNYHNLIKKSKIFQDHGHGSHVH